MGNSCDSQIELLIEKIAREWLSFCGPLHFNEFACPRHHHIQINLGLTVLDVIQVQNRRPVADSNTDGGHAVCQYRPT